MCAVNYVDLLSESIARDLPNEPASGLNRQKGTSAILVSTSSRKHSFGTQHSGLSLMSVISGTEYYTTRHSRYMVTPGHYLLLSESDGYSSYVDESTRVRSFSIHFGPRFMQHFFAGVLNGHLPDPDQYPSAIPQFVEKTYLQDERVAMTLSSLYQDVCQGIDGDDLMEAERLSGQLRRLLFSLLAVNYAVKAEISSINAARSSTREEVYKRLSYARDYMESSFGESISVDTIAAVACMHPEYFIRQFKKQFGTTPVQYLIARRMRAAGRALATGGYSVSEVCRKVGYADLTSFGKLFKRFYGIAPEAYSRSIRNSD